MEQRPGIGDSIVLIVPHAVVLVAGSARTLVQRSWSEHWRRSKQRNKRWPTKKAQWRYDTKEQTERGSVTIINLEVLVGGWVFVGEEQVVVVVVLIMVSVGYRWAIEERIKIPMRQKGVINCDLKCN